MENVVKHAVKKCPFLKKTPMDQIRKLSTMPAACRETKASALTSLAAAKCPVMKVALSKRIHTSVKNFATTNSFVGVKQEVPVVETPAAGKSLLLSWLFRSFIKPRN